MEFKTLSELISTDDLKRFGLPEVSGQTVDKPHNNKCEVFSWNNFL